MSSLGLGALLVVVVLTLMPMDTLAYHYVDGPVEKSRVDDYHCPGLYCGRSEHNETHFSACGKCDRGWRVANNTHSICQECTENPTLHDWLFLAFHVVLVLILHWMAIDLTAMRRRLDKQILALHVCATAEVAIASCLTVLVAQPLGSLELRACRVTRLSDWYTFFHNPNPNYEKSLNCTQEAVYPLYTIVFLFYGFCGLLMLLMRPFLAMKLLPRRGRSSVFAALYFLPVLALIQAIGGGLIYASYPYIVLILSLISSACHFAFKLDQSTKTLFMGCAKDARSAVILFGHWLLHAFGILSITLSHSGVSLPMLALVPVPSVFYILTARFSDPVNFMSDGASG